MTRRDQGAGTVYQRADGGFGGQIRLGTDASGKPRRKTVYGQTRADVRRKLREIRRSFEDGDIIVTDGRTRLSEFVENYIFTTLEARVQSGAIKRSTAEWHVTMLEKHVIPVIGQRRIDSVTPADIEKIVVTMGKEGLSMSTRRGAYTAIRQALDAAARDGRLSRNPAHAVTRPAAESDEARHLTVEEVRSIIDEADGQTRTIILVMAATALRRGEALALRWIDVDLEAATLRVTGTISRTQADGLTRTPPKSRMSRRTVPLAGSVTNALKAHRTATGRLPTAEAPVFPSNTGGWLDPRNFGRQFAAVAEQAGIQASPHTLRHSAATAMIAAGVPLPVVQETLGHADIRVTVGTYGHVVEDQKRHAAEVLGRALELD